MPGGEGDNSDFFKKWQGLMEGGRECFLAQNSPELGSAIPIAFHGHQKETLFPFEFLGMMSNNLLLSYLIYFQQESTQALYPCTYPRFHHSI